MFRGTAQHCANKLSTTTPPR